MNPYAVPVEDLDRTRVPAEEQVVEIDSQTPELRWGTAALFPGLAHLAAPVDGGGGGCDAGGGGCH